MLGYSEWQTTCFYFIDSRRVLTHYPSYNMTLKLNVAYLYFILNIK
ncbi:hypothetical protein ymoll0001_7230 [Yersinia mollaretii ATCC 43969]|uniref:Uncharacterized protein n=1 Tax=Yersinia mollaretii (strain ATCC 43969 / DSM 18520 / CIP 103324 / CNY 7263 / WAIP 204) TaxID=349967 RepID=A0ABM9Y9D8_YERMW|nr:hypothetical protein ymoll0001_7230 [Yersinia mollaretii ATCC 43969]